MIEPRATQDLAELADRLRAGYNRLLNRGQLGERKPLLERCIRFDRAGLLATPLRDARFVVLDTETTGLQAYAGDEIVQIALLEYHGLEATGRELCSLVKPQRPIPPASTAFHGIDDDAVATAPAIEDLIGDIIGFLDRAVLVGHHAAFDLRFLNRAFQRHLFCRVPNPVLDTMVMYLAYSGKLGHYELESVASACHVAPGRRHDARSDAVACAGVFRHLAAAMTDNAATVAQLLAAAKPNVEDGQTEPHV